MRFTSQLEQTFELLQRIDGYPQPSDKIVREFFRSHRYLGSHERRFISETVFGMLRSKRYLEFLRVGLLQQYPISIDASSVRKYFPLYVVYCLAVEQVPADQTVQSMSGFWQQTFPGTDLDKVVEWILEHRQIEYLPTDELSALGIRYSFQDWMVEDWFAEYGSETADLLQALNKPAQTALRVNILKAAREQCMQRLREEGIGTVLTQHSPVGLVAEKRFNRDISGAFNDGWFEFQDEGSQLISFIAAPEPGMLVIDACAGGGGKTLHLAEMMGNRGELIAFDAEPKRLKDLETRSRRAGVRCLITGQLGNIKREQYFGKADLVLVDAPCSGVGTIRRNPDKKWSITKELVDHYASDQMKILEDNSGFVKPNGRIVYATCSLLRKENENVISKFQDSNREFMLEDVNPILHRLNIESHDAMVKLLPHLHNTDGFFVAVLRRGD